MTTDQPDRFQSSESLVDWRRVVRTKPELNSEEKRSGATFVNILFGLVVTGAITAMANDLVAWGQAGANLAESRLAHLSVAVFATTLSWIGYHQSLKYPPFLIKFFNIPLWQFALDILMLVAYYALVATAEPFAASDPDAVGAPSAVSETALVAAIFLLYAIWDFLGYLMFRDDAYTSQMQNPQSSDKAFGARRWVTVGSLVVAGLTLSVVWKIRPSSPGAAIVVDTWLIVVLVGYRVVKQLVWKKALFRI